jgi:hypothetical protein
VDGLTICHSWSPDGDELSMALDTTWSSLMIPAVITMVIMTISWVKRRNKSLMLLNWIINLCYLGSQQMSKLVWSFCNGGATTASKRVDETMTDHKEGNTWY